MGTSRHRPGRLGEKLKRVRESLAYNMPEMATTLSDDLITIHKQDVHRYEAGQTDPPLVILLRYSRLAKVKMEVFADDELDLPR